MTTTLELLAKPQSEAVRDMIAPMLIPSVTIDDLKIEDGHLMSNGRSAVAVRSADHKLSDPNWPYFGGTVFSHRRMALEDFFQGIELKLKVPPVDGGVSTTSNAIVTMLSEIFRIQFAPGDYFSDAIESDGVAHYRLRATPTSLRWTGWVDIAIYPDL